MDCSPPGSSVHGILQSRILEWVAMSSSRGSSQPKDQTQVSCIAGRFFTTEPPGKPRPTPRMALFSFWKFLPVCSIDASDSTCLKLMAYFCPFSFLDHGYAYCILYFSKKHYFLYQNLKTGIVPFLDFSFFLSFTCMYYFLLSLKYLLKSSFFSDFIDCAIVQTDVFYLLQWLS